MVLLERFNISERFYGLCLLWAQGKCLFNQYTLDVDLSLLVKQLSYRNASTS